MTGDNASILKLREGVSGLSRLPYHAVTTRFEPTSSGWAFWRYFQKPLLRIADAGAGMVFEGDNDLVVDTSSMTEFSDKLSIPKKNIMPELPDRSVLHHLNYFEQPSVIQYLTDTLKLS